MTPGLKALLIPAACRVSTRSGDTNRIETTSTECSASLGDLGAPRIAFTSWSSTAPRRLGDDHAPRLPKTMVIGCLARNPRALPCQTGPRVWRRPRLHRSKRRSVRHTRQDEARDQHDTPVGRRARARGSRNSLKIIRQLSERASRQVCRVPACS